MSEWINVKDKRMLKSIISEKEADCRAKMLIYLLENGLSK